MKTLLALLLLPASVLAASEYDYQNNGTSYRLLESSVTREMSENNFGVSAIWEVTTPQSSYRWIIHANHCQLPYGVVTIYSEGAVNHWPWSAEGTRVYDYLAVATCTSYFFPTKRKDKK